jgi:hypothetical protein
MKVGVFYNSVTNLVKFSNKALLMDNFSAGVGIHGDVAVEFKTPVLQSCSDLDAGFVLGYTLENNFRKRIINTLQQQNIPVVFVDSNILHYARPEHEWHRYSINSVYPDTGTYFFGGIDTAKWSRYSAWHSVSLKPWRSSGNHILIFCQRPNGWNMFGNNQEIWLDSTIAQLRQHTDRPIMIRMHPGDGDRFSAIQRLQTRHSNSVTISTHANIREALTDCWCAVGYNSTPNVVAAIEGIPVYVEDPVHSWAQDVAFTDLSLVETPPLPDRTQWIDKIANIHWSNDEVKTGKLWASIKQHISSGRP